MQAQAGSRFTDLSNQLSSEAAPQRSLVGDTYSSIIKGGPDATRVLAPAIDYTKQAYANARRTLRNTAPNGGAFFGGNNQLAASEAQTKSNLYRDKLQEALSGLSGFSAANTSAAQAATAGQSSVANQMAELARARQGMWTSGITGLAGAFGRYLGARNGKSTSGSGRSGSSMGTPPYVPYGPYIVPQNPLLTGATQ